MRKKKIKSLITGGAGFIGSHLVDQLVLKGHKVIVLDNLSTGRISNLAQHTNDFGASMFAMRREEQGGTAAIQGLIDGAKRGQAVLADYPVD